MGLIKTVTGICFLEQSYCLLKSFGRFPRTLFQKGSWAGDRGRAPRSPVPPFNYAISNSNRFAPLSTGYTPSPYAKVASTPAGISTVKVMRPFCFS